MKGRLLAIVLLMAVTVSIFTVFGSSVVNAKINSSSNVITRPLVFGSGTNQQDVILQPAPGLNDGNDDGSAGKGKDTCVFSWLPDTPGGDTPCFRLWNSPCTGWTENGYIQFSLADMPKTNIVSAQLFVYVDISAFPGSWPFDSSPLFELRAVTSPWNEMAMTYNTQPTVAPNLVSSMGIAGVLGRSGYGLLRNWVNFDITDLYKKWADGSSPNYGIRISESGRCGSDLSVLVLSSDWAGVDPFGGSGWWPGIEARPKLVVTYSLPPTVTSVSPNTGNQGQSLTGVIITGTGFTEPTAVSIGPGITVGPHTVNSDIQITITSLTIDANALPGTRDVLVTTPIGPATGLALFTVNAAPPPSPTTPSPQNPLIGTGMPTSHGSSVAGTITTTQPVSLPNIQIQNASLSDRTVTPSTPITVTANIINKSAINGNKKVTLYVNGQVEATQGVTVNSGGSSKLTFNVSRSEPGDYNVYVDGVPAGSFKVELVTGNDTILIFSVSLIAIAFILGTVMLWRRQHDGKHN